MDTLSAAIRHTARPELLAKKENSLNRLKMAFYKNNRMDKIIITLTKDELRILARIMDHFTDYMMMGNDSAENRTGILKYYKEMKGERRDKILTLAAKIMRIDSGFIQ